MDSKLFILPMILYRCPMMLKKTLMAFLTIIWSVILASDPKNHHFSNTEAKKKFFEIFILRISKQDIFIPGIKSSQKHQTPMPMNNLVQLRSEK